MDIITRKIGNVQKQHHQIVKRYCLILDLIDEKHLINEYISAHSEKNHWKEIRRGLREIGILEMEIYVYGNRLVMIVETGLDFDWEVAFSKLETLPRQVEWETKMSFFQRTKGERPDEKWLMMDRIFHLYDSEAL
ncbi:L-rhamnose mutarotase [Sphingobacterium sp. DN00404]|uniref:L-rhamnose mutarotase n=1 Tax=Sphingobacterium micropteri TaxID=2763501 RepID=A0ABR7YQB3_9SPHI|nr:L-rhamnose mutarotase [Sphingobacterium micropteri]MBD1433520.1 L-rhamnose mutarotase [Sphingobacterium micropteri]